LIKELVAIAELVLRHMGKREGFAGEVLQQVFERLVGQALLVGPGRVAEDAIELAGVGGLDRTHGVLEGAAHVFRHSPHIRPVSPGRDHEAVVGGGLRIGGIAV
jgi:hypothetical protein